MKIKDSQVSSQTAKDIPGLKTKSDSIASPNVLTSVTTFGHAASSLIDLCDRFLNNTRLGGSMSEVATHEPENVLCQLIRMGGPISSQRTLEDYISRTAVQYGWQLLPGNGNKVSFDAYGYQAVTTFEISEHDTDALSAETIFSASPKNGSSWVDFGLILLCCVLVFILPEWCLGAIMIAAIIYVVAPIFLRDRYAEAEIRKFATSLMD